MPRTNRHWARREAAVCLGGLRLHLACWGPRSAPPLLLLHGGAANTHWWDWLAPELAATARVMALDFPGHGLSGWPRPPRYRMQDFVASVVGVADALGLSQFDLLGHSMGGKVGMLLAAAHPRRVRHLIIADATPDVSAAGLADMRRSGARPDRLFSSQRAAARGFRLIPPETVLPPTRFQGLALRSTRHRGHGRWTVGPDREFFRCIVPQVAWPRLARIRCPTLILRAERSSILARRTAEAMARAIPRTTLLEIPGTHHHLVCERPVEIGRAIHDFLTAHFTPEPAEGKGNGDPVPGQSRRVPGEAGVRRREGRPPGRGRRGG